jgi:transposase
LRAPKEGRVRARNRATFRRVENCFKRLKEFRRIATRYDKTDASFAAAIYLVGA